MPQDTRRSNDTPFSDQTSTSESSPSTVGPRTRAIRTQLERSGLKEHSAPLHLTSSFVFDDAEEMRAAFAGDLDREIYSRFTNPNVEELAEKMRLLEGAEAGHAVATGMAAIFVSVVGLLSAGDHIVACRSVFGSTHRLLTQVFPRLGIETTYVDVGNDAGWAQAIRRDTRMLFVETPTNPGLDVVDLEALGDLAKERDLLLVVDNSFATPVLQKPIDQGAHLVVHSATKYVDGQGRVMGGTVVGRSDLVDDVYAFCRASGPSLSPFNAWVLSKSLETLHLRMERHTESAARLARDLEPSGRVGGLRYPFLPSHPQYPVARSQMSGGGGLLTFQLPGGRDQGRRFLNSIRLCSLTANLGDTRTIVSHPASTTHAKLTEEERRAVGITPGLIRVSAGLEDYDDILRDILQALDRSRAEASLDTPRTEAKSV
jgi:O-succinylhomoserine sulfhydrylase